MANLQVKNVPKGVYQRLKRAAKRKGRTMRDLVLQALERELSNEEFHARLRTRSRVDLGRPAARALE
ncbi:MAG: toxin-antitoxin system HicB family antitoxin [Myxococcota bacterium]